MAIFFNKYYETRAMAILYSTTRIISTEQFIKILKSSTLAERRPVENKQKIEKMLKHADIMISAWDEEKLVGIARSITDFSFCCYLSDLAVDLNYQKKGVGKRLIEETKKLLESDTPLFLFSAPKAEEYYPKLGFSPKQAWILF